MQFTTLNGLFMDYVDPAGARIGHVHLKVANIERALGFYRDLLGFEVTQYYGTNAVFVSAGGYHHHNGLQNPTAENITVWIWQQIKPSLPLLSRIELYETPTTGVIYSGS